MAGDSPDKIHPASSINANGAADVLSKSKSKARQRNKDPSASNKRRCVSTACIACRRRKSKACHTFKSLHHYLLLPVEDYRGLEKTVLTGHMSRLV